MSLYEYFFCQIIFSVREQYLITPWLRMNTTVYRDEFHGMNTMPAEAQSTTDTSVASEQIVVPTVISSSAAFPASTHMQKNKYLSFENLFPFKLYKMLQEAGSLGLSAAVSWLPHGRAFIITDNKLFMTQLVPMYFKATKYRSFQRQCGLWGFHR